MARWQLDDRPRGAAGLSQCTSPGEDSCCNVERFDRAAQPAPFSVMWRGHIAVMAVLAKSWLRPAWKNVVRFTYGLALSEPAPMKAPVLVSSPARNHRGLKREPMRLIVEVVEPHR